MEATIILTQDSKEVSRYTGELPAIYVRELELIVAVSSWRRSSNGVASTYNVARALLNVSGMGLDVFMKEYGAHRLREQVKSMKEWL